MEIVKLPVSLPCKKWSELYRSFHLMSISGVTQSFDCISNLKSFTIISLIVILWIKNLGRYPSLCILHLTVSAIKHDLNAILQNSSLRKETGQLNFSFKGFLRVSEHTKINWPLILVKSKIIQKFKLNIRSIFLATTHASTIEIPQRPKFFLNETSAYNRNVSRIFKYR